MNARTRIGMRYRKRDIMVALSLAILMLALAMVLNMGGLGVLPPRVLRMLARSIVLNTYNPWNTTLTSYSFNAVSAVIWDYRGVDTIFETSVLMAAVTGIAAVLRGTIKEKKLHGLGMSLIVKSSTKIVALLTIIGSIALAVHGHLTPGGGFQAGSAIAAVVALMLVAFSLSFIHRIGINRDKLLKVRYIALVLILAVALIPLAPLVLGYGNAYILQNQVKEGSTFSMPSKFYTTPLAGSVFIFNILETVTVAAAVGYIVLTAVILEGEAKE
ncbi:MAG: MnhB domain-containing protein [Ignisphaera sp.]|uniref:Na+/H+ antiporter MnhB subunit-related protein domain-containing protein n=1 Tax=Ignisphaera aggregans TaxID=334771 RepID=A0A7C4JJT4_9CREN